MSQPLPLPHVGDEPIPPEVVDDITGVIESNLAAGAPTAASARDAVIEALAHNEAPDSPLGHASRFRVTDLGTAEWALARYAEAAAEQARIDAQAAEWARRIEAWHEDVSRRTTARLSFFAGLLEEFARGYRVDTGRATLTLPSGTVRTTQRQATVRITDRDALVEWAKEHRPDMVEEVVTYRVPAATVKAEVTPVVDGATLRAVTPDGEEVPGVTVEPARVDVSIKAAEVDA